MFEYSFTNAGQVDQPNREVKMRTNQPIDVITALGWLQNEMFAPDELLPTDHIAMNYGVSGANPGGTFEFFVPIFSTTGQITLFPIQGVNGVDYTGVVAAGDIACFANSTGTIQSGASLAINKFGSIQAGTTTGISGGFISRPSSPNTGGFSFNATSNSGNFLTTLTNAAMGQNTTIQIPDPGAAAAKLYLSASATVVGNYSVASGTAGQMVDSGAKIFAGTTGLWAGGASSHVFPVTNMTATDIVNSCLLLTSTNASIAVTQAIPQSGGLQVFFTADPGANTSVVYGGFTHAVAR